MKKFVSSGHRLMLLQWTIFINIFFVAILCLSIFKSSTPETRMFAITFLLIIALFTDFSVFRISKSGLYIADKTFYIQSYFRRKKVDLEKVKIIKKIATAIPPTRHQRARLLKDNHGKQLYSAVFLSNEIPDINLYPHDYALIRSWESDKVMFKTIYDKEAIEYILTLNPNIKLL